LNSNLVKVFIYLFLEMSVKSSKGTTSSTVVISQPPSASVGNVVVTLTVPEQKKAVSWTESVVDNELLNKKKSKSKFVLV
jgi:hypothetical protein